MTSSLRRVQPPMPFRAPALNPGVLRGVQALLPLGIRAWAGITRVEAEDLDTLVEGYRRFQAGEIRLLVAYRHPTHRDPVVLFHLFAHILPQVAAQLGVDLDRPTHAHFLYDQGIPLWAGQLVTWVLPRVGASPIQRGRADRRGLKTARDLLTEGSFPLAVAPEGGTNGHNELVGPLEPGVAQLGFWCMEDLRKSDRQEEVWILPLGVQYRYVGDPWPQLEQLLQDLEKDCGLTPLPRSAQEEERTSLYQRLMRLGEYLLAEMEEFYSRFYRKDLSPPSRESEDPHQHIYQRLQALLDAALQVAEDYFGLPAKGKVIDRCRRIEQAGWDRIFRQDLGSVDSLSALERGLADRVAEEADLRLWHMHLVESFVAVTGKYVAEKPTAERFSDTLFRIWELIHKLEGEIVPHHPRLAPQKALIRSGTPIPISERWSQYQQDRRSARQAVVDLTTDLQQALESLIQ